MWQTALEKLSSSLKNNREMATCVAK